MQGKNESTREYLERLFEALSQATPSVVDMVLLTKLSLASFRSFSHWMALQLPYGPQKPGSIWMTRFGKRLQGTTDMPQGFKNSRSSFDTAWGHGWVPVSPLLHYGDDILIAVPQLGDIAGGYTRPGVEAGCSQLGYWMSIKNAQLCHLEVTDLGYMFKGVGSMHAVRYPEAIHP